MAQEIEVECINKTNRTSPYERIQSVGGSKPHRWKNTQQDAIDHIEAGRWRYYVLDPRNRNKVYLVVRLSPFNNKYLKTEADGENDNNLLSLPECPPS